MVFEGQGFVQGPDGLILSHQDGLATMQAGYNAVWWSAHASWFDWLEVLVPFFWNWSEAYQREIRNG